MCDACLCLRHAYAQLAKEIVEHLGVPLGHISVKNFADGEIGVQVNENVRGKDVYIIQPTSPPGKLSDEPAVTHKQHSACNRASCHRVAAHTNGMLAYSWNRCQRPLGGANASDQHLSARIRPDHYSSDSLLR